MYVDRLLELSVKQVSWTVDFYLWFRWRGGIPDTFNGFQIVDGTIESKVMEVDETLAGERYQRFRVVAKITKFFDITRFPCDDHLLTIAVEHPAHRRQEVLFIADRENSSVRQLPGRRSGLPAAASRGAGEAALVQDDPG